MQQITTLKNQNYIDLSLLNEKGKQILIDVYKSLLVSYISKQQDNSSYETVLKAIKRNEKYSFTIPETINISNLANEINDVVL